MHPLDAAMDKAGLTQAQLSALVADLHWSRHNGGPLRLPQSAISEICSWKRRTTPEQAKAAAFVLSQRGVTITASDLLYAKRPEPTVAKPKKTKPRKRAA